jgi:hypothetical protein
MAERGSDERDRHFYRFTSVWHLDAPPGRVLAVLRDPEGYPAWWPQIRRVRQLDERSGEAVVRSLLPYELVLRVAEGRDDPAAGRLEVALDGDLEGWCRWRARPHGRGTVARYEQEVVLRKPLPRRLPGLLRPVLRGNHAWMMRCGRRGLARHLAAGAR